MTAGVRPGRATWLAGAIFAAAVVATAVFLSTRGSDLPGHFWVEGDSVGWRGHVYASPEDPVPLDLPDRRRSIVGRADVAGATVVILEEPDWIARWTAKLRAAAGGGRSELLRGSNNVPYFMVARTQIDSTTWSLCARTPRDLPGPDALPAALVGAWDRLPDLGPARRIDLRADGTFTDTGGPTFGGGAPPAVAPGGDWGRHGDRVFLLYDEALPGMRPHAIVEWVPDPPELTILHPWRPDRPYDRFRPAR